MKDANHKEGEVHVPENKLHLRVCGQFTVTGARAHIPYSPVVISAESLAEYRRYYYDDVVDFTFGSCTTYSLLPEPVEGNLDCGTAIASIAVTGIKARFMPYNILVFWLEVECSATDLNVFTALGATIRNCSLLDRLNQTDPLVQRIFAPVFELYRMTTGTEADSITRFMHNGNKFKLFQLILKDGESAPSEKIPKDILLYQLATVMKVAPVQPDDLQGMSLEYLQQQARRDMLCVFNNWRAIALFDTFTILAFGDQPAYRTRTWLDDYFGMIYVYNIFHKFYLQQLGRRFHEPHADAQALADELDDFRCTCKFNKISYNFLPNDVNRIMDSALDIQDERDSLHRLVHQEGKRQEERNATRLNNVLTFLTLLTIFSTLTDSVSLFWQLVQDPGDGSMLVYSRLVASVLVLIVLVIAFTLLRKPRK